MKSPDSVIFHRLSFPIPASKQLGRTLVRAVILDLPGLFKHPLTEAGYKLVGGRLDILENRRVAAIVYQHQDHFINEFVWPAESRAIDFDVQSLQGYSMCAWNKSEFNYLIVSELSQADLEKFEDQLRDRTE